MMINSVAFDLVKKIKCWGSVAVVVEVVIVVVVVVELHYLYITMFFELNDINFTFGR